MRVIPALAMLLCMSFATPEYSTSYHSPVVARILIENYHKDLYAEVYLKKSSFAMALKKEENCEPRNMISVCGSNYFKRHINFSLNGLASDIEQKSYDIEKDFIIYRYYLGSVEEVIETIDVESDFMLKYDDHSLINIRIKVENTEKHYTLKNTRRKITFTNEDI